MDLSTFGSPWSKFCSSKCFIIGTVWRWWWRWWRFWSSCNCLNLHPPSPNKSRVIIGLSPLTSPSENLDTDHWPFSWTRKLELLLLQLSCSFVVIICPYIPILIPTMSCWSECCTSNGEFKPPMELAVAPICAAFCNKAVADVTSAAVPDPETWRKEQI